MPRGIFVYGYSPAEFLSLYFPHLQTCAVCSIGIIFDVSDLPEAVSHISAEEHKHGQSTRPFLEHCSYTLEFTAERDGKLPAFPGSTIRGAFGNALKRLVCVMRNRPCDGCPLEFTCMYTTVFETRAKPSGENPVRNIRPPHPFVLKVDFVANRQLNGGDRLDIGITLYGTAMANYPFILRAMEEACEYGLGPNRLPFRLKAIRQVGKHRDWMRGHAYPVPVIRDIPKASGSSCRWRTVTPLRLRSEGKPVDHLGLVPRDIALPVLRRLMLLVNHYGNPDHFHVHPHMNNSACLLRFTSCDLKWKRLQRYSSRQSTTHSISGLMGVVGIDFSDAPEWGPILAWAPAIHVGKATSMGLGRVETV